MTFSVDPTILDWLMAGDPAIRWQVQRDLLGEKAAVYEKERARIARLGWGARYLSRQDQDGIWANALYSPKWISTHYTLWTLRILGLPSGNLQARRACRVLLDEGFRPDHGVDYSGEGVRRGRIGPTRRPTRGRGETCVTGMALAMFSYFRVEDERVDQIAAHLLHQQMRDQGWNCRYPRGATHASFNTTLLVLEGLREYEAFRPRSRLPIRQALDRGREFLLRHQLYRSHRTGRIVHTSYTRFPAQPTWRYDFLRALDHFQAVGAPRDPRLEDPIELLDRRRDPTGRWPEYSVGSGRVFFAMETVGRPSRWNTLRALRILKWWGRGTPTRPG